MHKTMKTDGLKPVWKVWRFDQIATNVNARIDNPTESGMEHYVGHLKALQRLEQHAECRAINLGTGVGYSVLDMVRAFEQASGKPVPYQVAPRRAGDIAACYADPALALALLGWRAERDLAAMCADAWRWQSSNPNGYQK